MSNAGAYVSSCVITLGTVGEREGDKWVLSVSLGWAVYDYLHQGTQGEWAPAGGTGAVAGWRT